VVARRLDGTHTEPHTPAMFVPQLGAAQVQPDVHARTVDSLFVSNVASRLVMCYI
jgi:hypothetical protein